MTPDRWERVKAIFDEVIDMPLENRLVQVHSSCDGDKDLEREVTRLLLAHSDAEHLLNQPLIHLQDFLQPPVEESFLKPGDTVANRFEILRFLSRGGMGEVYEAWDAELKTSIALKTIHPRIACDASAIERFKQEVRHAREISHPNICRVHDLFSHALPVREGRPAHRLWFLSMELLGGATLQEHLRNFGPFSAASALEITRQLVSGLAAAHAVGLVHRDFKSGNIILVGDAPAPERAVITDFGLSLKMLEAGTNSFARGVMGTPGYMAPEQEADGEIGPLADQYSLGIVLCEMLTGSLPRWTTPPHDSGQRPALDLPEGKMPGRWKVVISRCLERDPKCRFSTIEDVIAALDPVGALARPRNVFAAALALLVILIPADLLWLHRHTTCRICDLVQLTPETDESESPAISADGHMIAYSSDQADTGNLDIFLQRLPRGRPLRLTRNPARDGDPSLSADGSTVVFRSERDGGGIYLVHIGGGAETLLIPRGRNPQISPDGKSLLYWTGDLDSNVASGKIFLLSLQGGSPRQLVSKFSDARFPVWSPDGRALLFSGCAGARPAARGGASAGLTGCVDWWAMSLDGSRLVNTHVLDRLRSSEIVLARPSVGFWYRGGLLFSAGVKGLHIDLWRIALDPETWEAAGAPSQLLEQASRDLSPSLSTDHTIAYTRISGALHVWQIEHALDPGQAKLSKLTEDADIDGSPYVAEGGRRLVFARGRGSERSIWTRDNATGAESLLVSSGLPTQSPIIDPEGKLLAYEEIEDGGTSIYVKPGAAPATRLCHGCSLPSGWFNTDAAFFYRDGLPSAIRLADPRTGQSRTLLEGKGASLGDATWSPANEHLLFTATENGLKRMVIVRLPRSSGQVSGPWIPIPDKGASPDHPRWSGDGRTVVYISNSDGFTCIYGWAFSPEKEQVVGKPFAIAHFHNQRASIDNVLPRSFNLSVDRDSVFFDLGEQNSTVWTGHLKK